jgi:hypothetical protein
MFGPKNTLYIRNYTTTETILRRGLGILKTTEDWMHTYKANLTMDGSLAFPADLEMLASDRICPRSIPAPAALSGCLAILTGREEIRAVGDPAEPWWLSLGYQNAFGACGGVMAFPGVTKPWSERGMEVSAQAIGLRTHDLDLSRDPYLAIRDTIGSGSPVVLWTDWGSQEAVLVTGWRDRGRVVCGDVRSQRHDSRYEIEDWDIQYRVGRRYESLPRPIDPGQRVRDNLAESWAVVKACAGEYNRWEEETIASNTVPTRTRMGWVAEARWYAVHFFYELAQEGGDASRQLNGVATECAKEHESLWRLESLVRQQASLEARVAAIRAAGAAYRQATAWLLAALTALDANPVSMNQSTSS